MSEATIEFSAETKSLGDKIAGLTLKQAKELSDYLENEHGIKPAAGGAVMAMPMPGAGGEAAAAVEKTEFDVVMTSFGAKKLDVIKEVRAITGLGLKDPRTWSRACPARSRKACRRKTPRRPRRSWSRPERRSRSSRSHFSFTTSQPTALVAAVGRQDRFGCRMVHDFVVWPVGFRTQRSPTRCRLRTEKSLFAQASGIMLRIQT